MMTAKAAFDRAFDGCSLIAILRGVRPEEVEAIGTVLVETGFTLIEVPLNSPDAFESIARLVRTLGDRAMVGAGTVLTVEQVGAVREAGGTMVISPNTDVSVIQASVAAGLVAVPGFFTPSEAFAALDAGASALKLFPAEAASPAVLKAIRAVLPADLRILPVGGIVPEVLAEWRGAGAAGFGLGSALYRPGMDADVVGEAAQVFVDTLRTAGRSVVKQPEGGAGI